MDHLQSFLIVKLFLLCIYTSEQSANANFESIYKAQIYVCSGASCYTRLYFTLQKKVSSVIVFVRFPQYSQRDLGESASLSHLHHNNQTYGRLK